MQFMSLQSGIESRERTNQIKRGPECTLGPAFVLSCPDQGLLAATEDAHIVVLVEGCRAAWIALAGIVA